MECRARRMSALSRIGYPRLAGPLPDDRVAEREEKTRRDDPDGLASLMRGDPLGRLRGGLWGRRGAGEMGSQEQLGGLAIIPAAARRPVAVIASRRRRPSSR
jgi:hypothetical protein